MGINAVDALYSDYSRFKAELNRGPLPESDYYDETLYRLLKTRWNGRHDIAILDLGCGDARKLDSLERLGYKCLNGCDTLAPPSRGGINIASADLRTFVAEVNETFDLVIVNDVLEHLTTQESIDLLTQCNRLLKDGGCIYMKSPNGTSPFVGLYQAGDLTHKQVLNEFSIRQLASVCRLEVEAVLNESVAVRRFPRSGKRLLVKVLHVFMTALMTGAAFCWFRRRVVVTPNIIAVLRVP